MFRFILCFCLLGSPAWGARFIVGGQEVGAQDPVAASTVGIFTPSGEGQSGSLCTGSLIGRDMAVTAAHCMSRVGRKPYVIFGRDLHSPEVTARPAEDVAVHPNWEKKQGRGMDQGDIALVKFPGGLPSGYRKIPTLKSAQDIHQGEKVTLAGFGINDARRRTGAGKLRKTQVPIADVRPGHSEMIVDQSKGRGACHGDSGGPAFVRAGRKIILAGVTNRSYPSSAPDDCRHRAVYTKIPPYRSWIQKSERRMAHRKSVPLRPKL